MNLFEKFQNRLEKMVGPFAAKVAQNKYIKALTEGFMMAMPITLGVALIAVLINIPIDFWHNFLVTIGLFAVGQEVIKLTLSLLAIYIVGSIGYAYTKNQQEHGIIGAVIALASFMMFLPIQTNMTKAGAPVESILTSQLGSDGIFVAILCGLFIPALYCFLMKKNLRLKLPESVPPMVSQSLAPTFVAMIIFTLVFFIKYLLTLTSFGNVFALITTIITEPVSKFGASPFALILVFTLMNLIWFFGIHPNTILSCYMPILMMASTANTQAFMAGKTLPFFTFSVLAMAVQIGGAGNTLGLCLATLFAKSEKYKAMRKLVIPANLFNINEPIIFGFPIMLNPVYFFPMVFSPMISGGVVLLLLKIVPVTLNPTISMPWVTPAFITAFLSGGVTLLLLWLVALTIHFFLYLPSFLIDDKNALLAEQKQAAELAQANTVTVEGV